MARPLRADSPYRMQVPSGRDGLTGEARRWYDRAEWARGRTLDIPPRDRTAFQHAMDELWAGVAVLKSGGEVDTDRLERVFRSLFARWPEPLGSAPPKELL
jgi:hypothetical protein